MLMHARSMEEIRPRTPDERRAEWAARYFAAGHHRTPAKPRIRVSASRSASEQYAAEQSPPDEHDDTRDMG